MDTVWRLPPELPAEVERELSAFPGPLRQVLYSRGIESERAARKYLAKDREELHDPLRLPGMPEAVGRLRRALEGGKRIVVYGDYDADGVTATALLVQELKRQGAGVTSYLPDRFEEGYGLNIAAIDRLANSGVDVLLTVDCGIRATAEVRRAKDTGLEVILTDHHHPGQQLPEADAIVSPRVGEGRYPFKELAGVGLAYKLACALRSEAVRPERDPHLDLVALGTVADLAPLRGENRVLVAEGLARINEADRVGLASLIKVAGLVPGRITATHLGFALGPRLNAAGRMDSAHLALRLLLAEDQAEARSLAEELDRLNRQRQEETRGAVDRAREVIGGDLETAPVLLAADADFHEGIVGLVASRLTDSYYRPSLVARMGQDVVRGSARSIPGFHITEALESCSELLLEFGGHEAAAGFSLAPENLGALEEQLRARAEESFGELLPARSQRIDAVVHLQEMDERVLDALDEMEPFGHGNEAPVFASFDVRLNTRRRVGKGGAHLKLTLTDGRGKPYEGIAFRQGDRAAGLDRRVDLAYRFEWNEFRGYWSPQVNVVDIRPAGAVSLRSGT